MAANVTYPVQAGEPVSSRTRAALATISAHTADWEDSVASHSFRYSEYSNETRNRDLIRWPVWAKLVTFVAPQSSIYSRRGSIRLAPGRSTLVLNLPRPHRPRPVRAHGSTWANKGLAVGLSGGSLEPGGRSFPTRPVRSATRGLLGTPPNSSPGHPGSDSPACTPGGC